jgi:hypothetical protein
MKQTMYREGLFDDYRLKWHERKLKSLEAELESITKLKDKIRLAIESFKKQKYIMELINQIEERIQELQKKPTDINIAIVSELTLVNKKLKAFVESSLPTKSISKNLSDKGKGKEIRTFFCWEDIANGKEKCKNECTSCFGIELTEDQK